MKCFRLRTKSVHMSSRYPFRNVKADMVRKGLDLKTVAAKAKIPYTMASEILNGVRNDADRLRRLSAAIEKLAEVPA